MTQKELINLLGEIYKVLAALNAPSRVLDQVNAAGNGWSLPRRSLLPFYLCEKDILLMKDRLEPFIFYCGCGDSIRRDDHVVLNNKLFCGNCAVLIGVKP